jgi:hypothetical protein
MTLEDLRHTIRTGFKSLHPGNPSEMPGIANQILADVDMAIRWLESLSSDLRGQKFDYFRQKLHMFRENVRNLLEEDGDDALQEHWLSAAEMNLTKLEVFSPLDS